MKSTSHGGSGSWGRNARRARVASRIAAVVAAIAFAALAVAQPPEIARGTAVPNRTYPWAVSLHTGSNPSTANTQCSGSHVAPNFVLTAAHCFDSNLDGTIQPSEFSANEIWASLNRTRISDRSRGQVIRGAAVFLNPLNDIALLRLQSASNAPIVQLDPALPATDTNVTTAGWGFIDNVGTLPDNMQRGAFRVTGVSGLDLEYVNRNSEEMCGGDSGGPVFTELNGLARLVAAHTNSPGGCGIFTGNATGSRVDSAMTWIRNVIDANGFDRRGWVAVTSSGAVLSSRSYNSLGLANTASRVGNGQYQVFFGGLAGTQGHVQVTAVGAVDKHCKVLSWGPSGTSQRVSVRCFERSTGALADNYFNVVYIHAGSSQQPGSELAYLLANQPTTTDYLAPVNYQHNSSRARNRIRKVGLGTYDVTLPGLSGVAGTVHVTAYGAGSPICNVGGWGPSGTSTVVRVNCYQTGGAAVNTRFTLAYLRDMSLASNPNERGAYVWSYQQNGDYTTNSAYQYNSKTTSQVAVTYWGPGSYVLTLQLMPPTEKTIATATAYGSNRNCTVANGLASGSDTNVRVNCYAPDGSPADSRFTLSFSTNRPN